MNEHHIVKCAKSASYWSGDSGESVNSGKSDGACKISVSGESADSSQSSHSDEIVILANLVILEILVITGDYGWFWWIC